MIAEIAAQRIDLEMLKTAFGSMLQVGPVADVDAAKGYRIHLGPATGGGTVLSPWYPHPESGGQSSSWMPLSLGQVVGVLNPNGDPRQGMLIRGGFGGDNTAPTDDLAANVLKAFGITVTMKGGTVTIDGDLVVRGSVDAYDGHVHHNDTDIGDTHKHTDVMPGGGLTGRPV